MEFAFDIDGDEFDEDDDDENIFGGRGGEADILSAMLMGQMMGGIHYLTHSLAYSPTRSLTFTKVAYVVEAEVVRATLVLAILC